MAKVLGKANLFAACDYSQKKNQKGGGASYSKRISGFCFKKSRFTSLKMKSMALRCDLKGQRLVYLEKKTANKSRFYQVPIKAQVGFNLFQFLDLSLLEKCGYFFF